MESKIIKIKTRTINLAAIAAGMSAEDFVGEMRSISLGRKVCAHFVKAEGKYSFFTCE